MSLLSKPEDGEGEEEEGRVENRTIEKEGGGEKEERRRRRGIDIQTEGERIEG